MIGKVITSILTNDSAVTAIVSNRIYPILMEEDTKLPAISYTVSTIDSEYSKTAWANDFVNFEVSMYAKSYSGVNTLASAVRSSLERTGGTYTTTMVGHILMSGYSEEYDLNGDTYVITLNFRTHVKQY